MDQKLKERLLGAVIILSIMIIVLPILFKPGNENLSDLIQHNLLEDDRLDAVVDLELENFVKQKPMPMVAAPVLEPVKTVAVKPAPAPVKTLEAPASVKGVRTWVLRMGIFSNPKNAKLLVEKLSAKGYPAYSKVDTARGAAITRVFVGPRKTENEIKKIRDRLKKDLHLEGIVLFIKDPESGVT